MSKIKYTEVVCACCKQTVQIKRIFSFASDRVGLDGNMHNPMQYAMEECPECHYTSLDISDANIQVSKGMLNAFHIKPGYDKIQTPEYIALLKAADIYEKNKKPLLQAYVLRLASFYADDQAENSLSKNLLRLANTTLQTYFESLEELTVDDVATAIYLIDGNRRLGMIATALNMSNDLLALLTDIQESDEVRKLSQILKFEKSLLEKRDINEHLVREAL